jgi:hypothetical protein
MKDKKEKHRMLKQIVDALTGKKRYRENYRMNRELESPDLLKQG